MDSERRHLLEVATAAAERLSELAEVADLMGDVDAAASLRRRAEYASERAMTLLDE